MAVDAGSRLVVLGTCGAWPEPDGACSGFVLEHRGFRAIIDLGYGTLPRLLAHLGSVNADGIDAVIVSHAHPDHCIDLHGLFRARWFGRRGERPIPLYAPSGVIDFVRYVEGDDRDDVDEVFDWRPLPAEPYDIGPFRLDSWDLPHYVPNAGVRLTADDLVVAYTGDTAPVPDLIDLARGADLLIGQASRPKRLPTTEHALLLTADEIATVAAEAGARRLLLVHFWPGWDRRDYVDEARRHFTGEVVAASDGLVIALP
jgi:ribonuclease BN (tRNA processing enzyme)